MGDRSDRPRRVNPIESARRGLGLLRQAGQAIKRRATAVITGILSTTMAVLVLSGIPLIWQYEPTAYPVARQAHEGAGYILILVTLVLLARAGLARLRKRASHLRPLAALGVFVLTLAAGTTGIAIAWDAILSPDFEIHSDRASNETVILQRMADPDDPPEPLSETTGLAAATQPGVDRVISDGSPLTANEYQVMATGHVLVIPAFLIALYILGGLLSARSQRSEGSDASPGPETDTDTDTDGDASTTAANSSDDGETVEGKSKSKGKSGNNGEGNGSDETPGA